MIRLALRNSVIEILSKMSSPSNEVHILNSHFAYPDQINNPEYFKNFLKYLDSIGELIDFDVASKLVLSGDTFTSHPKFALSFDDGFLDCYEVIFHELVKRNIKAGFFINGLLIQANEKTLESMRSKIDIRNKSFMTWNMVKEMSDCGQIIGSHTFSHSRLSDITNSCFRNEILTNQSIIFDKIGLYTKYFAWPYGRMKDITKMQIDYLSSFFEFIYSGDNYRSYTSFSGAVINRRHVEPFWKNSHIKYFLSHEKNSTY